MLRISNSIYAVGGVIVAAGLIAFTNPKTVHAVAAALVEVTNTSANPVITQGIGQPAAEIVEVQCGNTYCNQILPNGTEVSSLYTTPANQFLVITSADIDTSVNAAVGCSAHTQAELIGAGTYARWWIAGGASTLHFTYPSGIVVPPATTLYSEFITSDSECSLVLQLRGYLTTN